MRSSSLVARPSPSFNRIDDGRHGRSAGQGNIVPLPPAHGGKPKPSRESQRGLDWFIFFLADVQTGFGPFIAVYLTTQKWTQVEIGFVLSIGGIIGLLGQMPGGAIVDAARSERLVAGLAVGGACVGSGRLLAAVAATRSTIPIMTRVDQRMVFFGRPNRTGRRRPRTVRGAGIDYQPESWNL